MRATTGPLAAARRWTTGTLVGAALAAGVVVAHLSGPATSAVVAGDRSSASGSASANDAGDDGDDGTASATPSQEARSGFGVVPPVRGAAGQAQTQTSGS